MSSSTLSEVGQLEALKLQGNYDTGQMFLHKVGRGEEMLVVVMVTMLQVFGYRGVILFPWMARVYDRDMPTKSPNTRYYTVLYSWTGSTRFCVVCYLVLSVPGVLMYSTVIKRYSVTNHYIYRV